MHIGQACAKLHNFLSGSNPKSLCMSGRNCPTALYSAHVVIRSCNLCVQRYVECMCLMSLSYMYSKLAAGCLHAQIVAYIC